MSFEVAPGSAAHEADSTRVVCLQEVDVDLRIVRQDGQKLILRITKRGKKRMTSMISAHIPGA